MLKPDFTYMHTVKVRRWLRRGINADEFGTSETIHCRVNFKRHLVSAGGSSPNDTIAASGLIFMPAGLRLSPKDKLMFEGKEYTILSCLPSYDYKGVENHVEVEIQ